MNTLPPSQAGTQRRIRALCARGWSGQAIERATGLPAGSTARALANRRTITPDLASRMAAAYDCLWNRVPPCHTPEERQDADAARAHAGRCGWAPPMAWDDDQIDRPDGRPAVGWKRTSSLTRSADLVEDAEFVREHGGYRHASVRLVALRLGVTEAQLEKAYSRRQHADPADRTGLATG